MSAWLKAHRPVPAAHVHLYPRMTLIPATADKPKPSVSQTPCLHCDIELSLLGNCHWWRETIFHSTQSVVNWNQWGWIVWLKFDRITDDQQWQQTCNGAPFFSHTNPLNGLNVVQCGPDDGSLLILLEFILKAQLFQYFTFILNRGSGTVWDLVIEKHRDFPFESQVVGLLCLWFIFCSRRTTLKKHRREEAFKDPLVVNGSVLCFFVMQRFVLLDSDHGVCVCMPACFLCVPCISLCERCAPVKVTVINQVTKYQIGFHFFLE